MIGSEWKCLVHFLGQFLRKKVFVIFFFHFAIGWKILKPETASWTIDGSHIVEMLILTHSGWFTPSSSVREKLLSYWSRCIVGLSVCTFYMPICACVLSCFRPVQPTLCDPMDCNPPSSSDHGILQARILEWVTMPSSRGSSGPRNQIHVSCVSCIGRGFFTTSTTWETLGKVTDI